MNEAVSCVVRIIHELVYSIIHQHVHLRKMESETASEGLIQQIHEPLKKWDKTLYQYFGAVLQHKITLRKKTFAGKKRPRDLSKQQKLVMEKELEILQ